MKFSTKLTQWYNKNKRDFPWRNTTDPYLIWLSEIIMQQTQTIQGLPYFVKFSENYPTVFALADANEQDILKLWQGLGYYSRARNLHFSAKYIVNELQGEFPDSYKKLLALKGVGDYTASAIASISYNEKCAVVDGNVYRVLSRYFAIDTPINSSKGIKEFKLLAQELLPSRDFGNHNQAIMDFGATICKPKKPKCDHCIFNDSCLGLKEKMVSQLPVKTSKTKVRNRYFNYLVILTSEGKTVLNERTSKGIWQNLYEFPLIETETEIDLKELISLSDYTRIIKKKPIKLTLFNKKIRIHKLSHQHLYTKFWIIETDAVFENAIPYYTIDKYPVPTLINNFLKDFIV